MHKSISIISMIMLYHTAFSQIHGGVEQYYYASQTGISAIVPKAYFQNKSNWYSQLRFNYEQQGTVSFNAGKTFSGNRHVSWSVTPLAGVVAGTFNGASAGLNINAEKGNAFFSAETQYTGSFKNNQANFFYNWSEAGYSITDVLFTGIALQYTHYRSVKAAWEPGIMAGLSFGRWQFPLYVFNPAGNKRYFVLGINMEWARKQKVTPVKGMLLLTKANTIETE